MGSAPEREALEALLGIAELELRRLQEDKQPSLFPPADSAGDVVAARKQAKKPLPIQDARALEETKRVCVGFHEANGILCDWMGLGEVFTGRQTMARRLLRQAVLLRLAAPGDSKSGHARRLSSEEGSELPVEKSYRIMDAVSEGRIRRLQEIASQEVIGLLGGQVDVLFFDVTTLSIATGGGDELRKKGYSKDDKVHVVLALIQKRQGLPIGYELFAGNTTDERPSIRR